MRRPSLWLALGIAVGAAINDSVVALLLGVAIAAAPYVGLAALDLGGRFARLAESLGPRSLWREIEEWRPKYPTHDAAYAALKTTKIGE